ncbi:MAG TPA: hypothetical protein VEF72_23055 [Mycobacterium sp.]|nr:hypothetical protein [Mycobacterium sp.]
MVREPAAEPADDRLAWLTDLLKVSKALHRDVDKGIAKCGRAQPGDPLDRT